MTLAIQPQPLRKHELILQERRLERMTEERKLVQLKAQLLTITQEQRKPVRQAS